MQVGAHHITPRVIAAASLCAVLLALIAVILTSPPEEYPIATTPIEPEASSPTVLINQIRVEISGGVLQPGVIALPEGSRLIDGISAAGGWGERVDPLRVELCLNLAAPLEDGSAIRIPTRDDRLLLGLTGVECGPLFSAATEIAAAAAGGGAETGATGGKIDLNKATAEELDTLPGIGPATAAKIIASRAESPFIIVDDLRARGLISERVLGEIRALVTP
jgi:competence protein ComEA